MQRLRKHLVSLSDNELLGIAFAVGMYAQLLDDHLDVPDVIENRERRWIMHQIAAKVKPLLVGMQFDQQ